MQGIEMQHNKITHIIVVGGGIAGLSAAWYLQQSGQPVRLTLVESGSHWGGKMVSAQLTDDEGRAFIADGGPESFITRKPEVWDLAHELGVQDQLVEPTNETKGMHVLHDGEVFPVPLSPVAFMRSNLMTSRGKLRMLTEPFVPARHDNDDESLAEFARRRLGDEALTRFIGPILGGIYNTDPERQSIMVSSPVMRELERDHGGLFKGMIARIRQRSQQKRSSSTSTPLPPRFITFTKGTQVLADAIVDQLDADSRLNTRVEAVERVDGGGYRVRLDDGDVLTADAVVLATPANIGADLLRESAPDAAALLDQIDHSHIGTLSLAYRAADIPADLRIRGLMIPRKERRAIDAVTWTSGKVPGRSPDDTILLRVYFGGAQPQIAELDDADLLSAVRHELADLFGIHGEPLTYQVFRWLHGYPQADVGHLSHVDAIEAALPDGLYITGSSYRGVAVPDCIRQSQQVAEALLAECSQATQQQHVLT